MLLGDGFGALVEVLVEGVELELGVWPLTPPTMPPTTPSTASPRPPPPAVVEGAGVAPPPGPEPPEPEPDVPVPEPVPEPVPDRPVPEPGVLPDAGAVGRNGWPVPCASDSAPSGTTAYPLRYERAIARTWSAYASLWL